MKHLGTKTIETKRLLLRKFEIEDAPNMYKNWANDKEVTKFLTWLPHDSVEVSKEVIELWQKEGMSDNSYQWCIEFKEIKEPIGSIGVVHRMNEMEAVEIGYCIGKKYWNKGLVSEAFDAIITFFFNEVGANRIESRHDTNNPASGKVMQKCGLKLEGIKRQADRNNSGICDMEIYGILKEDWKYK